MKLRNYLTALCLFAATVAGAQSFGAAGLEVKGTFSNTKPVYYDWLRKANTNDVIMKFPQTPQGIEDAMEIMNQMLLENQLLIAEPNIYNSVGDNNIQNDTPAELNDAIQSEEAKINLAWYAADGSIMQLFLGPYSYEIDVYKAYKI